MTVSAELNAVEPPKTDADEALVGRVFARKFKLTRLLGAGGMGAVYEAQDLLLGRRVAVKLMKPAIATNGALVQRFVREARAADSIQHKNIVRVLDLASDDETGSFFIVQELLTGESLAERLDREGALTTRAAVEIMVPVLDALAAAHDRGIVHRDVKPENVFLHREADGHVTPKLIDFGISKVAEGGAGLAKTQTGTALGTPYYMSPEQVRGDASIDHRADQWSAGIMLFELVAGRRPFVGENYNLLILEIMTRRAPRADELVPGVQHEVATIIARALEPNRDDRFESTAAFRAALEALRADDVVRVSRTRARTVDDAPTMDAPAEAFEATLAADQSGAVPLVSAPVVSETNALAIAEARAVAARAEPDERSSAPARRPASAAVIAGVVLAAVVSVGAIAGLSRGPAQRTAQPVVERNTVLQNPQGATPPVIAARPAESAPLAQASATADAGVAALGGPRARPRTTTVTGAARPSAARPTVVAATTQTGNSANATAASPTQNTAQNTAQNAPSRPEPPGTTGGGGFRPITTYSP